MLLALVLLAGIAALAWIFSPLARFVASEQRADARDRREESRPRRVSGTYVIGRNDEREVG